CCLTHELTKDKQDKQDKCWGGRQNRPISHDRKVEVRSFLICDWSTTHGGISKTSTIGSCASRLATGKLPLVVHMYTARGGRRGGRLKGHSGRALRAPDERPKRRCCLLSPPARRHDFPKDYQLAVLGAAVRGQCYFVVYVVPDRESPCCPPFQ
ncbi:unnamed protein product, partial [Ectocarpus sp. 13 AM-2016]